MVISNLPTTLQLAIMQVNLPRILNTINNTRPMIPTIPNNNKTNPQSQAHTLHKPKDRDKGTVVMANNNSSNTPLQQLPAQLHMEIRTITLHTLNHSPLQHEHTHPQQRTHLQ